MIVATTVTRDQSLRGPSVTSYHMKIERKKQREELNVASAVERGNGMIAGSC